ncbi:hypothetical protein ACS0TY_027212 [Phlomoides rotata]
MESPFFRNRRCYQQPDLTRCTSYHPASIRDVPVYSVDPTHEIHRPDDPVHWGSCPKVVRIPVHFVGFEQVDRTESAVKIQKVFRGFLVRKCLKKVKDIGAQVDEIEEKFSKSEIVELLRRDERERLRMNETLMSLLFKLDSICGVDFGVRRCRKAVIRKVIALQERIDAIAAADLEGNDEIGVSVETENSGDSVECLENLENVNDLSMEVKGDDEEVEVIDVGVDFEVKVSESNGDLDVKDNVEKGLDDNKRNRELVERMMEESEKMTKMMSQLCERNEMQTKMLNALTQRVERLEKAFVCDKLRKKNKTATCKKN